MLKTCFRTKMKVEQSHVPSNQYLTVLPALKKLKYRNIGQNPYTKQHENVFHDFVQKFSEYNMNK